MLKIESLTSAEEGVVSGLSDDVFEDELIGTERLEEVRGEKVITKLTSGVRDVNRVNVFLDGRFAFSLDVAQVVELQVKVGQKVTLERLEELRSASEFGKLYQRTLEWVLTRPHSVRETYGYLRRRQQKRVLTNRQRAKEEKKPFPEIKAETVDLVVNRLLQRGYLDDQKFARYFVENRFVRKGVSKKRLRMELQKKGVASNIIEALLAENVRDDEAELKKMIAKKRARYDDQKLAAYLVRQGFEYQKVIMAISEFSNSDDDN